jgi:ADP-heptose:LPS heptosyltransferase
MNSGDFIPTPNPGDTLRRVLVIKLGALGDFVQALGAMRVVRATHPSARITLLTTEPLGDFAKACPYFDIVETDGRPRDIKGRTDLIRRLRQAGYDMVYDFQNNDRTGQYFAGLTGKKPLWSGAAAGASHRHQNPHRGEMHNFDRLAEQLVHAGLGPRPPGDPSGWIIGSNPLPSLEWIRPAFRNPPRFQPAFFSLQNRYMLLIPGSSPEHPEKRWPMDRFAAVATWFADMSVTPVVVGGPSEGDLGAQIARLEPRARNLVGRTDLFQLATLSERCVMAIGGDTGPMHIAAAAGAQGICLFAQEWTRAMELELGIVWSPETRLGRAAPTGRGTIILIHAAELEGVGVEDVRRAARGLMGLSQPAFIEPQLPAKPAETAASAPPSPAAADVAPEPLGSPEPPRAT